jgi:hypothetical protein
VRQACPNQGVRGVLASQPFDEPGHQGGKPVMLGRREHPAHSDHLAPELSALVVLEPCHDGRVQSPEELLGPLEVGAECRAVGLVEGGVVVHDLPDVRRRGIDMSTSEHIIDLGGRQSVPLDRRARADGRAARCWPHRDIRPAVLDDRAVRREVLVPRSEEGPEARRVPVGQVEFEHLSIVSHAIDLAER